MGKSCAHCEWISVLITFFTLWSVTRLKCMLSSLRRDPAELLCLGQHCPSGGGLSLPPRASWGFPFVLALAWQPILARTELTPLMWHLTTNYSQQFGASVVCYLNVFIPGYHPTTPASEAGIKAAISKAKPTCNLLLV